MTLIAVEPPVGEPVSLAEAKAHLRVEHDGEDGLIESLVRAPREEVERATGMALMAQGWRLVLDDWPPDGLIHLMRHPVRAVASVTVFDDAGEGAVLPAAAYRVDALARPGRVLVREPVTVGSALNGIEVDFSAGFGEAATDVPDTCKRAILLLLAHWFEFRGVVAPASQPASYPAGFAALLEPFRLKRI